MQPHQLGFTIVGFFGFVLLFYAWQVARRMKRRIVFTLKRILIGEGALVCCELILPHYGYTQNQAMAMGFVSGVAAGFLFVKSRSTSRRIPKRIRQAVIARDLKGEKFDPRQYHIDHRVPFSRGGDHSMANLRVKPKEENLAKGARMPRFRDLF
jgi:hypothetical protein